MQRKMHTAADLIRAQKYHEARKILKTMPDPTAYMWLQRLDTIAPEPRSKWTPPRMAGLLLSIGLLIALIVGIWRHDLTEAQLAALEPAAASALHVYCLTNTQLNNLACNQWVQQVIREHHNEIFSIVLCDGNNRSVTNGNYFAQCLIWNEIPLPF
jgi:hypothetical protein